MPLHVLPDSGRLVFQNVHNCPHCHAALSVLWPVGVSRDGLELPSGMLIQCGECQRGVGITSATCHLRETTIERPLCQLETENLDPVS